MSFEDLSKGVDTSTTAAIKPETPDVSNPLLSNGLRNQRVGLNDAQQDQRRLNDFNNTMKPSSIARSSGGIIGNIGSNGLRSDAWKNLVSQETEEKILGLFLQGNAALQKTTLFGETPIDLCNAESRNRFINKIMDLHGRGTFSELSKEDQVAVLDATRKIESVAMLVRGSARELEQMQAATKIMSAVALQQLPIGYTSPMAELIAATAMRSQYWRRSTGKSECLMRVTEQLSKALKTGKRFTAANPMVAVGAKLCENHYGYVAVEGATFQDVQNAPVGAVAFYDNPKTGGSRSHAQIKVSNGEKGWVSDFRHDAYVYGSMPPSGLKFYLYVPKDYVAYIASRNNGQIIT